MGIVLEMRWVFGGFTYRQNSRFAQMLLQLRIRPSRTFPCEACI